MTSSARTSASGSAGPSSTAKARRVDEVAAIAETARHHLDVYTRWVHGLRPAAHHQVWIEKLEALTTGSAEKRRLLIIAPPGCAKSTYVSQSFPTWYLGHHPDHALIFATSTSTMAGGFDGTVKTVLEENERHARVFADARCRADRSRGWSGDGRYLVGTPSGSKDPAYRAIGFGTSVIGARAHGIILDDPLTQEQAQSALEQERAWRYWSMTLDSRLHPDVGWVVAIMTRWAEGDLAGRFLAQPDLWDVVIMPAMGYWSPDAPLWPARFSAAWLKNKEREIGPQLFACMYQGDPTALGGVVFRSAAWFRELPTDFDEIRDDGKTMRQRLRIVQYWDTAFSSKQTADYSVCLTAGVDSARNIYLLDCWRGRVDADTSGQADSLDVAMVRQTVLHKPVLAGVELAAFRQSAVQDTIRRVSKVLAKAHVATVMHGQDVDTDKVTRARLPAGRTQMGFVYADKQGAWWPTFVAECLSFPNGKNDDQVDALSGLTRMVIESLPDETTHRDYQIGGKAKPKDETLLNEAVNAPVQLSKWGKRI